MDIIQIHKDRKATATKDIIRMLDYVFDNKKCIDIPNTSYIKCAEALLNLSKQPAKR